MIISIVIPFLNEELSLPTLLKQLELFQKSSKNFTSEIIMVDDGSTDNSVSYLKENATNIKNLKLVRLSKNFGSHAALRAGLEVTSGDFITFVYADLQDPLYLITEMVSELSNEREVVWAVRDESQGYFSCIYAALMRRFALSSFPFHGFDIVMFSDRIRKLLIQNPERHSSIFLQILSFGFPDVTIRYSRIKRQHGSSKWTFTMKTKFFIDSFLSFTFAPVKLIFLCSFSLFLFGILGILLSLISNVFSVDMFQMSGSFIFGLSIVILGFAITNFSIGILGEYIWRTLDICLKRPIYLIYKVEEIS